MHDNILLFYVAEICCFYLNQIAPALVEEPQRKSSQGLAVI
jgi:hypothetical protein